jgi:hypothetical protein
MRINSDTGSNYTNHRILGENATIYVQNNVSATYFDQMAQWPRASATASAFGALIIDILDYANTNKKKTLRSLNGSQGNNTSVADIALTSGLWNSTSAITSISITGESYSGGLPEYSQFALYGIKGA